jgi:hypothetical protein
MADWTAEVADIFGKNEPLVFEEIQSVLSRYSTQRIYQLIDIAISEGKLQRFENGIYFIPTQTIFGISKLDPQKVIFRKFIKDKDKTYGYYSGLTLLNGLGLTTQVPNVVEVVTNNEASRLREVFVGKQKVRLRKARVQVTSENVDALAVLDLFNQINPNMSPDLDWRGVIEYVKSNGLNLKRIMDYSYAYPAKAVKNLMNSEVAYAVS